MLDMKAVFGTDKPIIGMVHLRGGNEKDTLRIAREEIGMMYGNGVDAVLVENYFGGAWDVMRALQMLSEEFADRVYGVNVLGDEDLAFRLAQQYGAKFIQIDSVCGHLNPVEDARYAEQLQAMREKYPDVAVFGGVRFKYQPVNSGRSLEEDLRIGMTRCDAVVVTGAGTAKETELIKIRAFKAVLREFPLIVGAGMTPETAPGQLEYAEGGIVGSYFKEGGVTHHPMDESRVAKFMDAVRAVR